MATVTGLSGNEIYCMALKGFRAGELVVGNSVNSMGFLGSIGAGLNNILGGEVPQVTQAIQDGRMHAFARMAKEAQNHGASGVAGVSGDLRAFSGNTEFLFVGSCVLSKTDGGGPFFTTAGNAQELYCHMDAGYTPIQHVFGNIAYSMGVGGGFIGAIKQLGRGEISEYSDVFNKTRHKALDRITAAARADGANAVLGIRTTILPWMGTHEMVMTGTAASHPGLPADHVVTSDLTGEELWSMASLGYAPMKLLMSTSIYSLGLVGGIFSALKSFAKGEISELTSLVHDAREHALDRLKAEADSIGSEEVVGVKTYIIEIGQGLIEFMAIGTAVQKVSGMGTHTQMMPAQAIVHDKDTWMDADMGMSLMRSADSQGA